MLNKTNTKKDIVSYRNKHYIAIASVICITVAQIFALEGLWKMLVYTAFAFVVGALVGTYEEKDELTNLTLLKATEFTFFIILGALFVSAIFIENLVGIVDTTQLAIDLFYYILLGGVAVRSLIFLILDRTPKIEDDEDEEDFEEEVEEIPVLEEKPETNDIEQLKAELKAQLFEELKEKLKNESKVEEVIEETAEEVVEETAEEVVEETAEETVEKIPEEVTDTKEEKPKAVKTKNARKS